MDKIYLIGNAHLDPVWLWRWQEGFAEIKATFRSVLDRMNEYEDLKFASACSAYYMWIEQSDKAMFEEIQKRVKEGRWNIVGGWFIQPDCNLPSGESFARHALISQRYFQEKFGITAKTGYNVDSFGHNGNLPKILQNSGMSRYVFMRPMEDEKELPKSLFHWKSSDGSSVMTYRIPLRYGIGPASFQIFFDIAEKGENIPMMAFFGLGNHGGGPTIELLDKMHQELDDNFIYSTPDEYFDHVQQETIPVVQDDLQYHAKGCYSAFSKIKTDNRLSENNLVEAEKYSVLSNVLANTPYPSEELLKAWEQVLFNQFHDILGGCCIKEAYQDAERAHGEALNIASKVSNFALQQISWNIDTLKGENSITTLTKKQFSWVNQCCEGLGIPLVVFNPLPYPVEKIVQTNYPAQVIKNDTGEAIALQQVRASRTFFSNKWDVAFKAEIPAFGYRVYRAHAEGEETFENPFLCTENSIENEKLKLTINPKSGEIESIFIKEIGQELLQGDSKTVFVDESDSDTWAHGISKFKNVAGICENGEVKLIENGPLRATLRTKTKLFDTEIIRDYSVESGSDRVLVHAIVHFNEKHKMLKFSYPVNVKTPQAFAKIPFGFIERTTDGAEQVCGEWSGLWDENGGIVLANRDKYSFDADQNVLSMTVLRGAIYADHCLGETSLHDEFCEYMDMGEHRFSFSISPFRSLSQAEKEGQLINSDFTVITETFHKGNLPETYSGITLPAENIAVTGLKKYEDGEGWVLRCYETENKKTTVPFSLFGTEWEAEFSGGEVKTFIISNNEVKEADFMEWKR